MVSSNHFSVNQPVKPEPALVTWLSVNFMLFFLLIMRFTVFPVLFATGPEPLVLVVLAFIVLVPVLVFFAWVGLYYKSMWYELREDEMSWKRGSDSGKPVSFPITGSPTLIYGRGRSCGRWVSPRSQSRQPDIPARQFRKSGLKV